MGHNKKDSFQLTNEEVEQAMILNKCGMDMLKSLLGLVSHTRHLSSLVLFAEKLGHSKQTPSSLVRELEEIGNEEGALLLESVKGVICEEWGYCHRRATDGLGDPRRLVQVLAPLIGPKLRKLTGSDEPLDRTLLVVSCVFIARTGLSALCHCDGR